MNYLMHGRAFTVVALAVALSATIGCDDTVATPAGTEVLSSTDTSLSVSGWTVGAPVGDPIREEAVYRFESELGPPLRFKVDVARGPVAFNGGTAASSAPATIMAPSLVTVSVVENTGWAVTASCDPGLKVPLAVNPDGTSAIPASIWAECRVVLKRKNGDITISINLDAHGDKAAEVTPTTGTVVKIG